MIYAPAARLGRVVCKRTMHACTTTAPTFDLVSFSQQTSPSAAQYNLTWPSFFWTMLLSERSRNTMDPRGAGWVARYVAFRLDGRTNSELPANTSSMGWQSADALTHGWIHAVSLPRSFPPFLRGGHLAREQIGARRSRGASTCIESTSFSQTRACSAASCTALSPIIFPQLSFTYSFSPILTCTAFV